MKKVLIASTALVAAGLMTAGTASASEKIKLNLGGYSKWWVVGAWQNSSYRDGSGAQPVAVDVKGDNEVYFGGSTTLDNGLKIGIDVQLEAGGHSDTRVPQKAGTAANALTVANANAASAAKTDVIDESYVWIEGGFGKLIVGSKNNGTYLIHNTAPDAAGNWNEGGILSGSYAIAQPSTVHSLGQIANDAATVSGFNTGGTGNTTAILTDGDSEGATYVSPSFYGFTFGASYKPNGITEDNRGFESAAMPVYGVGLLYANTFGGVGVKADVGFATYNPQHAVKATNHRDQNEYSTGLNLSYAGFTVGGSYRKIEDNRQAEGAGSAALGTTGYNGYGYDAGIQYASGPYAVSLAYFHSSTEGAVGNDLSTGSDKIDVYQLSGKYTLGAGVDALASAGYARYKDGDSSGVGANNNKGWTVMTGLSLAF
ncbi:MAG TPA: porin [Magnetospirillum sp.]|jgi:hypothetical protein|nr:porin [Magnetospirillum sp.]